MSSIQRCLCRECLELFTTYTSKKCTQDWLTLLAPVHMAA
jgi:hypothetical protein